MRPRVLRGALHGLLRRGRTGREGQAAAPATATRAAATAGNLRPVYTAGTGLWVAPPATTWASGISAPIPTATRALYFTRVPGIRYMVRCVRACCIACAFFSMCCICRMCGRSNIRRSNNRCHHSSRLDGRLRSIQLLAGACLRLCCKKGDSFLSAAPTTSTLVRDTPSGSHQRRLTRRLHPARSPVASVSCPANRGIHAPAGIRSTSNLRGFHSTRVGATTLPTKWDSMSKGPTR